METAKHCLDKAASSGIRVILDPGGISGPVDELMDERVFFLKPNEHEARILTGQEVIDFDSARQASEFLLSKGVQNVFLTHGNQGAYLFNKDVSLHIRIPGVKDSGVHDETGCGDQVTAIVASCLAEGRGLIESAELAVKAGTLQFYKAGIQPISREELFS